MALIGNRSVLHKSPGRFLSGTVASIERSNFNKPGMLANRFQSMSYVFGGLPTGHLAPSSWSLPRTGGAMSSRNEAVIDFAASGNAAQGINLSGSASIVFDVDGLAAAIASASGSASIVFTVAGNAVAPLSAIGTAAILFTATGQLSAPASVAGTTTITFAGAAVTGAIGHMVAEPIDAALTPDVIAAAVWAYVTRTLTSGGGGGGGATAEEVWEYATRTLTVDSGLTVQQAAQLAELWRLAGLDIANPMTVTPTTRVAGAIELEFTGDPDISVTVTRQ